VREAREAGRITTAGEVDAMLADRLAAVVDKSEGQDLVRAVAQLRSAMDRLPLAEPGPAVTGDGDGGRGRVLELIDRPPQVGDSSHAG
jgi:hypothetical protein